jgi:hypothetical protein
MTDEARDNISIRPQGSLRLHRMPDRRMVHRYDRLRQKWWALRARLRLRLGRRRI